MDPCVTWSGVTTHCLPRVYSSVTRRRSRARGIAHSEGPDWARLLLAALLRLGHHLQVPGHSEKPFSGAFSGADEGHPCGGVADFLSPAAVIRHLLERGGQAGSAPSFHWP